MLRKKEVYTNVTPIPPYIPRQLAIDILHSHSEIITLNPLVLEHHPIKAPRDAAADEYYATWYDITERIQYIPGMGKMGSGKISFKGCFHDMPYGLQTHIYAPMNVDIRNTWRVAGNQPGEPAEVRELGIDAPAEGLYLREDIEIKCNITLVSFVKAQLKAASKVLVERLIKKAELLDAGVLHAMMQDGKLKTLNPADRSSANFSAANPYSAAGRPLSPYSFGLPPSPTPYNALTQGQPPYGLHQPLDSRGQGQQHAVVMELPGDFPQTNAQYPGTHLTAPTSPTLNRFSSLSDRSAHSGSSPNSINGRWSEYSSRPISYASEAAKSPGSDKQTFAQELPSHAETREEHNPDHAEALKRLEATDGAQSQLERPPNTPEARHRYSAHDYGDLNPQI